MFKLTSLVLAIGALILSSCSKSTSGRSVVSPDSVQADTPVATAVLPDTMFPSAKSIKWHIDGCNNDSFPVSGYTDLYASNSDVLTFRKTLFRDADFGGTVKGTPDSISVAWKFDTYYNSEKTRLGVWGGGSGWTGQPLYLAKSNEIVVGSLCGRVYFIDFNSGNETRKCVDVTNTIKGTVSKDPILHNLYVGQGVPNHEPFGNLVIDLKKQQITCFNGRDPKALRGWNAWDSSPVVVGDYLFWPAENGSFYKYQRRQGSITPLAVLRYTIGGKAPGIENSLCVYGNYGYFGDNAGNILCVNLNNMHPVWCYDNKDDIDASIVCEPENGTPFIYVASEVDKQGPSGFAHLAKLNALNGSLVWEQKISCRRLKVGGKYLDGGFYSTPLPGKGNCSDLLFANVCRNGSEGGQLIAFSKKTGQIVRTTQLRQFAWSSPVAFYNEKHEMFILTGDSGGCVYLIDAKSGHIIFHKQVAFNFESSPVVVGNAAVVGSRQNGILKLVVN